jgi:anti-anti-sigma factor
VAIKTEKFDKFSILTVDDDLTNIENQREFENTIKQLLNSEEIFIAFDFSIIKFVPSRVVGIIVNLHLRCVNQGGEVALLTPHEDLMEIFNVVGLEEMLRIVKSKEDLISG